MYCTLWFSLVLKALYSTWKSWPCWRARKLTNNYRSIAWDNEGFLQMAFNTQIWLNVQARNKCYQMCWTECLILIEWYPYEFDFEHCNCHFHRNFLFDTLAAYPLEAQTQSVWKSTYLKFSFVFSHAWWETLE